MSEFLFVATVGMLGFVIGWTLGGAVLEWFFPDWE